MHPVVCVAAVVLALTSVLPDAPAITFEWHDLPEPLETPGPKDAGQLSFEKRDNRWVAATHSSWKTERGLSMREIANHERKG